MPHKLNGMLLIMVIAAIPIIFLGCESQDKGIESSTYTVKVSDELSMPADKAENSQDSQVVSAETKSTSQEPIDKKGKPESLDDECKNATGDLVEVCKDKYREMILENPSICENATGILAYMCNQPPPYSAVDHKKSNVDPCASVEEAYKLRCQESVLSDPNNNLSKEILDSYAERDETYYTESYDPNNLPQIASHNFTELDKFSRMTRIRSGVGHDYSDKTSEYDPDGLNCRSMKHYFIPVGVPLENQLYASTPHTFAWMSIKFFAPTDGIIQDVTRIQNPYGPEAQFTVKAANNPGYYFNFFHVNLDPKFERGSTVEAGQLLGTLGSEDAWGEIAVEARVSPSEFHLLSFLQVANDDVIQQYKERGFRTISDVVISKEDRDANPIACDRNSEAGWFKGSSKYQPSEAYMVSTFESTDHWFFLTDK